ncbi:MAG: PhzF family phenazine biosynthesis protein [bacterium]|nr:PhzF family phenazine biosynthesis protein [bacterium]
MHDYLLLDVFAENRLAGNQLAVVLDAGSLTGEHMQAIAREFNFSETSFVCSAIPEPGEYPVRIFTPTAELPFAGHPTLGTAWAIRSLSSEKPPRVVLKLGVGSVPVEFDTVTDSVPVESDTVTDSEIAWMRSPTPVLGEKRDPAGVAELLGLQPADLDSRFSVQEASVGISFLMVPLVGLSALRRARLETAAPLAAGRVGVLLFCPEGHESTQEISARLFFEAGGMREDPATGSANACLALYLSQHRYLGSADVDARVGQGYEMARASTLHLRVKSEGENALVSVGGRVQLFAKGQFQ